MPFDFTVWTTDLLAAGIGGLVGGTIGSYFKAYSAKKAEDRATYEDLPSLLKQEFAKAFEQETGRRLASHRDIENVMRELQSVTEKTETIKAEIGTTVWLRQTLWTQRRESYARILKHAHAFKEAVSKYRSFRFELRKKENQGAVGELLKKVSEPEFAAEVRLHLHELYEALSEAEIFLNDTDTLRRSLSVITAPIHEVNPDVYTDVEKDTNGWIEEVIVLARRQLGIDTTL